MENSLVVKTVDFMGDSLMVAKDKDGVMWAGVSGFCKGLGMSKGEKDRQTANVQTDDVLKRGATKFEAGVFDPNNEAIALQLDYVPLWLTKISITPNMKESKPELVEKLIEYQLKAKDVLAAAFLPQKKPPKKISANSKEAARMYVGNKTPIVTVGNEVYEIESEDYHTLGAILLRLNDMEMKRIPDIARAFLQTCAHKPECLVSITDDIVHAKMEDGEVLHVEAGKKRFINKSDIGEPKTE